MMKLSESSLSFLRRVRDICREATHPYRLRDINYSSRGPEGCPYRLKPFVEEMLTMQGGEWTTLSCTSYIGREVYFYLSIPAPRTEAVERELYRRVQMCCAWFGALETFASGDCSRTIEIYMFFSGARKTLPDGEMEEIGMVHANTAFTSTCRRDTHIILHREEEWFKVFIHETFHALGMDFSSGDIASVRGSLQRIYRVDSEMKVYETYSEIWADIINLFFIEEMEGGWLEMLERERYFSVFQAGNILRHFGMTFTSLGTPRSSSFREGTQIFCYYVLRSIWMYRLDDFLKLCNGSPSFRGEVTKFVSALSTNLSSSNLSSDLSSLERLYVAMHRDVPLDRRSLRMTLYG
jgi:hypothetical protein